MTRRLFIDQSQMEFVALLSRLCPGIGAGYIASQAGKLLMASAKHCKIMTDQCNRNEKYEGEWEARELIVQRQMAAALEELNPYNEGNTLSVVFEGDPRGYTCKLSYRLLGESFGREFGIPQ